MDQHDYLMIAAFGSSLLVPWALIWIGHWFPWRKLLKRQLRRGEAYIYGTVCILIVPTCLLMAHGEWAYASLLMLPAMSAGAATGSAYWIDKVAEDKHRKEDEQDRKAYAGS